jgi:hypothetical protein
LADGESERNGELTGGGGNGDLRWGWREEEEEETTALNRARILR